MHSGGSTIPPRYHPIRVFFFGPNLKLTQSFYNPKTSLKQPRLMIELIFLWPWDAGAAFLNWSRLKQIVSTIYTAFCRI